MRTAIITLSVLISFSTIYAQDQAFDGYMWENTPVDIKVIIVAGFISGYTSGAVVGIGESLHLAINMTKQVSEKHDNKNICEDYSRCSNIIKDTSPACIAFSIKKMRLFDNSKEAIYYVREVDSFLKTYPLCRRKNVMAELLPMLALVWFPAGDNDPTYKDMGEECSKSK